MKTTNRERGIFKNGNLWWMRLAGGKRVSTGTDVEKIANRVARMVHNFEAEHVHRDLLTAVHDGGLDLIRLYDHHAAGSLDVLRAELASAAVDDPDLDPMVDEWDTKHLAGKSLTPRSRENYVRQVRAFIPQGIPFPCSQLSEEYVKQALLLLPVSDSTKRRYLSAFRLFCRFVRRRIPGFIDPLTDMKDWQPKNASGRTTWWNHRQEMAVLDRMSGEARRAVALMLGSGMELSALHALTYADILGERMVAAHGTKNAHRDRMVVVDAWADRIWREGLPRGFPTQRIFTISDNELRTQFYRAQIAAEIIKAPRRGPSGKMLWGEVGAHTLHDCRHTYAIVRGLGLDGEPKRSIKFVSQQLGHANEQMVMTVYGRAGVERRAELMNAEIEMDKTQPAVREMR